MDGPALETHRIGTAHSDVREPHDRDYLDWVRDQMSRLRAGEIGRLDIEALIEDLARGEAGLIVSVESAVARVIEHLLKLEHSPAADPRNGWRRSVIAHRHAAQRGIKRARSVVKRLDLEDLYAEARDLADHGLRAYGEGAAADALPDTCPYTLEQILMLHWYPANRHGLE